MDDLATQFLRLSEDRRRRMTNMDVVEEHRYFWGELVTVVQRVYGAERGMNFSKSLCPDGFNFFSDVVTHAEFKLKRPLRYLEIGSFEGVSMSVVGSLLRRKDMLGPLCSIDPYFSEGYSENIPVSGVVQCPSTDATMKNARRLYQALDLDVDHIRMESHDALREKIARREQFDLIYIDGLHRGLSPTIDFGLSMSVLAPDGIVVLDDWPWPDIIGLKRVCDRSMTKVAECPDIVAYAL